MALTKDQKDALRAQANALLDAGDDSPHVAVIAATFRTIRLSDPERGYSLRNMLLLYLQAEERGASLTLMAGFHEWREQGRMVRKGEPGYFIMAGGGKSDKGGDDAPADSPDGRKPKGRSFFGGTYVWDIAQTDPIPADAPASAGDSERERCVA